MPEPHISTSELKKKKSNVNFLPLILRGWEKIISKIVVVTLFIIVQNSI